MTARLVWDRHDGPAIVKGTKYFVRTWDTKRQRFTPQIGVRVGPYTLFGLRKAFRKLRDMGFECSRWDNSTLVQNKDNYTPG